MLGLQPAYLPNYRAERDHEVMQHAANYRPEERRMPPGSINSHLHIIRGGSNFNMELREIGRGGLTQANTFFATSQEEPFMVRQAHILSSARDTARSRERSLRNRLILGVATGAGATAVIVALLKTVWFVSDRDASV
jgi:hypothetical protein